MTNTKRATGSVPPSHGGTAAPGFHLSGTLDWSSLSAQGKNRVAVVPGVRSSITDIRADKPKVA